MSIPCTSQDLANCVALARQGLHAVLNDRNYSEAAVAELADAVARASDAAQAMARSEAAAKAPIAPEDANHG